MSVFRLKAGLCMATIAAAGGVHAAAQIDLTVTVGTDPSPAACAASTTIGVAPGTPVNYCYRARNTGTSTLQFHDLVDDIYGTVLDNESITLAPGQETFVTRLHTVNASVADTGQWTARTTPYQFKRSSDPGGPAYDFVDISTPGAGTALSLSDDGEVNLTLPFPFVFDGATSNQLRVGNNGGILFGTMTGDVGFENQALPTMALGRAILPFWDDFDDETGNVYYTIRGTAPQRRAIIQWQARAHYIETQPPVPNTATFEVILAEGGNTVLFQYKDVDFGNAAWNGGASATVGLNLADGLATQFSFNTAALSPSLAILFTPTAEAASDRASASVVALIPELRVSPSELQLGLAPDSTDERQLLIANNGNTALNWSLAETATTCDATTDVPWLVPAPLIGDVPANAQEAVDIGFDSTGLADGDYTAALCLTSDDPNAALTAIPVTLHVGETIFADGFEPPPESP